ncbi:LOW QUALITY PROTEIN: uncharacterized protein [Nyctibius grandis]|uniref:LOW QUALITY PROTEIN: uncharacterized protein n=1 Tax=Nyctibius grandis TaxID=48427 RepID=UPI0035BC61AA
MPMELHGGADIHVQFMEDPMPEQGDGPKGGCDPVESAPPPPPERPIRDIGRQPGNGPILRCRNRNCDWRLHVSVTLQIFSIKEAVLPHHMRTPPRLLRTNEDRRHTAGDGLYPNGELEEARRRYDLPQNPPQPLRPLVKVEYAYEDSEDDNPRMVTKEVPYTATELAKLKNEYSRNPTESETEYVWRVSLTGGDQILLSEREAEGYWAPGVFLTPGGHRAPWSLTQQAAYWAGGLNPLERGDPLALTGSVDQLVENVQKAACLQMMHDGELKFRQESPVMVPVDPERMTPLVRGLPDSLKPLGIQLQSTIRNTPQSARVTAALTGGVTHRSLYPGQKVWTWGEVAQELINYGRKYGPVNTSLVRSESKGLRPSSGPGFDTGAEAMLSGCAHHRSQPGHADRELGAGAWPGVTDTKQEPPPPPPQPPPLRAPSSPPIHEEPTAGCGTKAPAHEEPSPAGEAQTPPLLS